MSFQCEKIIKRFTTFSFIPGIISIALVMFILFGTPESVYAVIAIQNDATGATAGLIDEAASHVVTLNVATGATIAIVIIGIDDTSEGAFSSISNSGTAYTWILGGSHTNGNQELRFYYALPDTTFQSTDITVSFTAATDNFVDAYSLTGTAVSSPIDHTSVNNGTDAAPIVTFSATASDSLIAFLGLQSTNGAFNSYGTLQVDRGNDAQGGAEKVSAFTSSEIITVSGSNDQSVSLSKTGTWLTLAVEILAPPPPPTVTTDFASNVGATSANLNGVKTGGDDATEHGFAYGTDPTLATVIATTTLGALNSNSPFTSSVGSLSADTVHYVRAYATSAVDTGYGIIRSFVTGNTTLRRKLRLFEGFSIKFLNGRVILQQL